MSELLDKANRLHEKGKYQQADKLYLRVLKSNPKDASALHMRGVLKMQTGNTDYAIQLLKASLQVATNDPWVHYHLGECFRLTKNFRSAEEHLVAAQSMGLDDPDLYFCLAEVQAALGKFDQAINCYETALRSSPQDSQIAQSFASVLHQAGRATEATLLLQKTLLHTNKQTEPTSHNNLTLQLIEIASSFDTTDTLQTYIDNLLELQNQHSPEILIDALGGLLEHKQLRAMNSLVSLLPSSTLKLAEVQLFQARFYCLKPDREGAIAIYTDLFANTATPSQIRMRTIRDLVQMDEVAVVNQLAGRFDLSARCDLAVLHQLTGSLVDLGQFQTAQTILDACKNPELKQAPMTSFHYGICAQVAGDFKSASLHHREAIRRDNHLGTAAYALASIGSSSITDDELEAWTLLVTSENVPDTQLAYFQFAVARVLDSREQYASAYEYYLKGNEMMSHLQPFDSEAWSETIDAIIETYDAAFFDKMKSAIAPSDFVDTDKSQVFIVGMPRSGSTLLEREICRHFDAQGLGEHSEMRRIFARVAEITSSQSGIRTANELNADHIKMFRHAYLTSLPEKHSAIVVDKMLGNLLHLGLIATLFPEARAIYCDRSLEATAVSCFTNIFSQGLQFTYSLDAIRMVWNDCQRLVTHWKKVLPIPLQSIKYDELVRYPSETMDSIESALQLKQIRKPQDASSLGDHAMHTASFWQARQPTYTSSIEHWRRFQIEF